MGQSNDGYVAVTSLGALHWIAVLLAIVTGGIHLYAGFVEGRIPVLLAGLGFLGATGLFLIGYRRRVLYSVGIVYTAVQIPLWYVAKAGEYTTLGYVDKIVQIVLVLVLAYLYWDARSGNVSVNRGSGEIT